jgi:hypothetical protein
MNKKDRMGIGVLSGLFSPLIAFSIYAKIKFPEVPLSTIVQHVKELGILTTMISLCVFINLLIFFIFIWSDADRSARGVLAATFLYAFVVLILKLT